MTVHRPSVRALVSAALVLAVALAFLVAPRASTAPDGLERVAAEQGIDAGERDHPLDNGLLAGYGVSGSSGAGRPAVAGVVGIACCFLAATGLAAARRRPTAGFVRTRPAACKVAVAFVWVVAVAVTPTRAVGAFAVHAALVGVVARLAAVPAGVVLRRLVLDIPFVVFALALPFVGPAPDTQVAGVALSTAGLWAMWGILAKATLGLVIAVLLGATTPVAELLRGLEQLRVPRLLVAVAGLMARYLSVLTADLDRLRVARVSRGAAPHGLAHLRAAAAGAGTLFVRSYERGERVHLAMASRGFTGRMPDLAARAPSAREWFVTGAPGIAAIATTAVALAAR